MDLIFRLSIQMYRQWYGQLRHIKCWLQLMKIQWTLLIIQAVQPEVTTTKTEVVKSNDSTVSLGSELADKILKAMETGMKDDGRSYTSQLLKEKKLWRL